MNVINPIGPWAGQRIKRTPNNPYPFEREIIYLPSTVHIPYIDSTGTRQTKLTYVTGPFDTGTDPPEGPLAVYESQILVEGTV